MSRSDEELVADALHHLAILRKHMDRSELSDQLVADAVSLRLAAAIEALGRGSEAVQVGLFGEEWSSMWATRNRIAHGYIFIDLSVITSTIDKDVPQFETRLEEWLASAHSHRIDD